MWLANEFGTPTRVINIIDFLMYKLILIVILNFWFTSLSAQYSAIGIETNNTLFLGIQNKISIAAENTSCNSLVVKVTNGNISGENCQYIYSINFDSAQKNHITDTKVEVYKKNKNKLELLTTKGFIIKKVPDPVACILTCNNNRISYLYFQKRTFNDGHPKSPDIRAEIPLSIYGIYGLSFDCHFVVDSFYYSIFRGDSCLVKPILNKGNYFTDDTHEIFKQLKENDTIIFDRIYAKGSDGSKRVLNSLTIKVSK